METIKPTEREARLSQFAKRYRQTVTLVKGAVQFVLRKEEVVDAWAWLLARASLDITEKDPERVLNDLTDIRPVIERIGARVAIPEGYAKHLWEPLPKIEFWKSHLTGENLPNPWVTGNRTEQSFIHRQLGEEFAAELEIAARGGRTYQEEFARRESERLAEEIIDFPDTGFNPYIAEFDHQDRSPEAIEWQARRTEAIRELERTNPPLNEWLKKIAKPQFLNPFENGEPRNITRQMEITRADPDFAKLLKRTARWKEHQLDYELAEAERAAADAKARLEERRHKQVVSNARARYGR